MLYGQLLFPLIDEQLSSNSCRACSHFVTHFAYRFAFLQMQLFILIETVTRTRIQSFESMEFEESLARHQSLEARRNSLQVYTQTSVPLARSANWIAFLRTLRLLETICTISLTHSESISQDLTEHSRRCFRTLRMSKRDSLCVVVFTRTVRPGEQYTIDASLQTNYEDLHASCSVWTTQGSHRLIAAQTA